MPAVSVIIPVYNVEQYVERCIRSVLAQDFTDIEIILVDDGSTDASGIICDSYSLRYANVQSWHKENGGLSDARNYGLDRAQGDYIFFVDSDDYIRQDAIGILYRLITQYNADLAICGFAWQDEDGREIENCVIADEVLNCEQLLDKLSQPGEYCYAVAWNKMYDAAIWKTLRFPKGKLHEDEFTVHRIFLQTAKAVCTSIQLYFYIRRHNSIMTSVVTEREFDSVEALYDRYCEYDRLHLDGRLYPLAKEIWSMTENLLHRLQWKTVSRERRQSIRYIYKKIYAKLVWGDSLTSLEFRRKFAFKLGMWAYCVEQQMERWESKG